MKFLYAAVAAALLLPSVGCQSMGAFGNKSPMAAPSHVTQSQRAPRPTIMRAAYMQSPGVAGQMQNMPETGLFQRCGCECGGYACGGGCNDCCGSSCGGCECSGGCDNGRCRGGRGCNGGCCYGGCGGNGLINSAVSGMLDCAQTDASYNFNPGPAVAQTAYPYYSVRGPRDFLLSNPPTIGPGGYSPNCPY